MAEEIQGTAPTLSGAEGEDGGGPAGQDEATVADVEKEPTQKLGFMNRLFRPFTPRTSQRTFGGASSEVPAPQPVTSGAGAEDGRGSASQDEGAVTGVKNNTLEPVLTLNPVFGAEFEHESEYIGEEEDMASDEGLFSHSHLPHSKLTGPLR
jgi:hypothetical protein